MLHSYHYYILAVAGLVGNIHALPLNINLGAYSPALVVGDGEISFGGQSDVNGLMNVLEGAAVNAAAGVANGQPPAAAQPAAPAQAAAVQQGGQKPQPVIINPAPTDKQLTSDQQEAQQIASFLGIDGKQIDPRVEPTAAAPAEKTKRDLSGFDRALRYAEAALVKGPKVQLGTGAEGSGVGIIVDNNQQAAARPGRGVEEGGHAAAPAPGGGEGQPAEGVVVAPASLKEKRGVEGRQQQQPRRRARVTTMYVRSGIPAEVVARSVAADIEEVVAGSATVKREIGARDGTFDSVNLNVPGEGVTMTFVETADEEAEEPLDGDE
ncbi:hypothetical protein ACHAQA_000874 [Verticillium albo-atrum]